MCASYSRQLKIAFGSRSDWAMWVNSATSCCCVLYVILLGLHHSKMQVVFFLLQVSTLFLVGGSSARAHTHRQCVTVCSWRLLVVGPCTSPLLPPWWAPGRGHRGLSTPSRGEPRRRRRDRSTSPRGRRRTPWRSLAMPGECFLFVACPSAAKLNLVNIWCFQHY